MARRMRPKQTRLEVRALALTPAAVARRDEIVEEIVDQLRPWKEGEAAVIELVQNDLRHLLCLAPLEATGAPIVPSIAFMLRNSTACCLLWRSC
jgi:hypothetical protein